MLPASESGTVLYKYVAHARLAMRCDQRKQPLENQHTWLPLAPMSRERRRLIARRLQDKNDADAELGMQVLELFEQRHIREKLEILALESAAYRRHHIDLSLIHI